MVMSVDAPSKQIVYLNVPNVKKPKLINNKLVTTSNWSLQFT